MRSMALRARTARSVAWNLVDQLPNQLNMLIIMAESSRTRPKLSHHLVNAGLEVRGVQDWREGRAPRPRCRLPDGRGRHSETSVRRHPSAHRGTTAAAGHVNSVISSICHAFQENPWETRVLMKENSACLSAQARADLPRTYLQARAESQRHFILVKG